MESSVLTFWEIFYSRSDLLMQAFWGHLRLFTPWWLVGIVLGATVTQLLPRAHWPSRRWLNGPLGAALGALLGILSPLPLFGAIGVVASLAGAGVSVVSLVAFLFASPLLNPNQFVFTGFSLGWDWALARAAGALILGASGGLLTSLFLARGSGGDWLLMGRGRTEEARPDLTAAGDWPPGSFVRKTAAEAKRTLGFSWRYFILALILSAWVVTFLPRDWVMAGFGQGQWWGVPAAVVFGVPGYLCGGGAVPLVYRLSGQGMSQGAGLAFLLGGSATTVRNLAALGAVAGRRGLVFFLILTQGGAIVLGLVSDLLG